MRLVTSQFLLELQCATDAINEAIYRSATRNDILTRNVDPLIANPGITPEEEIQNIVASMIHFNYQGAVHPCVFTDGTGFTL